MSNVVERNTLEEAQLLVIYAFENKDDSLTLSYEHSAELSNYLSGLLFKDILRLAKGEKPADTNPEDINLIHNVAERAVFDVGQGPITLSSYEINAFVNTIDALVIADHVDFFLNLILGK